MQHDAPGGRRRRWRGGFFWAPVLSVLVALAGVSYAVSVVPAQGEPGPTQRGFALPTWSTTGYDGPQLSAALSGISSVGGTWVQLNPTWYQNSTGANQIVRTSQTATDAGLERAINMAHAQGLKVFLKPHVDLTDEGSRSLIAPADRPAWFASYTTFITHYATIAARTGVEQFAVGTELASVSDDRDAWMQVIGAVRAQYRGTLVYAADPGEYAGVPFWDAVDLIGIDAYWPLSTSPTTDVAALEQAWAPIRSDLAAFSARIGRRILFTEAAYASQQGTTTRPHDWTISNTPNQAEQAAAYQALLSSFSQEGWWAGVYWWVWSALPDDGSGEPLGFPIRGKAAEQVVREWWAR